MNRGIGICANSGNFAINQPIFTMKKITYLFLSAMLMMLFACTQEDVQVGQPDDELSKAFKSNGPVFHVDPSGFDDTDELLSAFASAKAAGPGATVQLTEGTFHISFMLIEEFVGTFNGAGMGKTIIEPLDDLPSMDMLNSNQQPELLKFLRGNVQITNMSFLNLATDESPAEILWALLGLHDWAYSELPNLPEDHKITAVVDHVEFAGMSGLPDDPNIWILGAGIAAGPDFWWDNNLPYSNADITVTNCTMHDMEQAFFILSMEKGKIVFNENGPVSSRSGLFFKENIGGSAIISDNDFYTTGMGSVYIDNADWFLNEYKPSEGAQYEISRNEFHLNNSWGAITIADDRVDYGLVDNENPVQVLIEKNLFDLKGETWVGIWNWRTDDAVIRNNIFKGTAKVGIYVDPRTTNSLILGNNFSNLVCTSDIEWLPGYGENYKILLLGNINTVVGGGNNSTTVLNIGENNQITGAKFVNEGENPLGQTIVDNYMIWKESLLKMKNP